MNHPITYRTTTTLLTCLALAACGVDEFDEFEGDEDAELALDDALETLDALPASDPEAPGATVPAGPVDVDGGEGPEHQPAMYGDSTTSYHPVVRIQNSDGKYCTATAISDDLLMTTANCVKSGTNVASWVKVTTAHGANTSAQGRYSSYFVMSKDIHDNVDIQSSMTLNYITRNFAFVKFGQGTFSSFYSIADSSEIANAQDLVLVNFGHSSSTKRFDIPQSEYFFIRTTWGQYSSGKMVSDLQGYGTSGGPMLVDDGNELRVVGVLFGNATYSMLNTAVHDYVSPALAALSDYCGEGFTSTDYEGVGVSFCEQSTINDVLLDDPDFADDFEIYTKRGDDWNDEFSSFNIPDDMIVTLAEHQGLNGKATTLQSVLPFGNGKAIRYLGGVYELNDRVSEVQVRSSTDGFDESWQIEISRHSKCIDLAGGNTNNGANIQQRSCDKNHPNQTFVFVPVGNSYEIRHEASDKCLTVTGTSNNSNVVLSTCQGNTDQRFSISDNDSTTDVTDFMIRSDYANRCLDLAHGSSSNGANIQVYSCKESNKNQRFAVRYY